MESREFEYSGHFITVIAVQQRDQQFHPSMVIVRGGGKIATHRSEVRSAVFNSQAATLAHGAEYAMRWVDLVGTDLSVSRP